MTSSTTSIITTDLVLLDVDAGEDKQAVIGRLVQSLADAGRATDADGLRAAAMAREEQSATGLPGGIAIPHCRSPHVDTASIGFARLNPPVDFGAPDGPADLAFLIAAPEAGGAEHLKLLSSLARALVRKDFVESLRQASTPGDVVALVDGVLNPDKPTPVKGTRRRAGQDAGRGHRMPDRYRAHLHGGRLAGRRGQEGRRHAARRDAGLLGQHAARCVDDRRGRRRHLRHRCRRQGQAPLRGQARRRIRCETGDQRARQDGRRSACRRGQPERGPRRGRRRAVRTERGTGRRRRLGHPHASDSAHRRELHDPVRRRRRPADRARIPVRGIRDRQLPGRREPRCPMDSARSAHVIASNNSLSEPAAPAVCCNTSEQCCSASAGWRSCSWCPHSPATSRSRSPTGPASRPGSPQARSPSSSAADSSAASSAVSSPASPHCG